MSNRIPERITQTIHAGLGNQLFQLSFALSACKYFEISNLIILKPFFTYNRSRPFELTKALQFNSKVQNIFRVDSHKYLSLLPIFSKIYSRNNYYQLCVEKEPFKLFDFSQINSKFVTFYGYFQNYQYAEDAWDEMSVMISSTLSLHAKAISMYPKKNYNVIHIRGGDTTNGDFKHLGTLLSPNYYHSLLENLDNGLSNIIVTDDEYWVSQIMKTVKFPPDTIILGSRKLSSWETLALMSDAKLVISANSTLSWWGSYICMKRGGQVVLPKPWSRDWDASRSLIWKNCATQDSIFY